MREDLNSMTRPLRIEPRNAQSVTKEWLEIDQLVQCTKPEFYKNTFKETYRNCITEITKIRSNESVPLIAISDLLITANNLETVIHDMKILKRRIPRPIENQDKIKAQVLAILKKHPKLIKGLPKGTLLTNLQIIVREIANKCINNYDFASYVEKARSLDDIRKMCGQAKSRVAPSNNN